MNWLRKLRVRKTREGWYVGLKLAWMDLFGKSKDNVPEKAKKFTPTKITDRRLFMYRNAQRSGFDTTYIRSVVDRIERAKHRYKYLERVTGVPWQVVGVIHCLEANCDFDKHLHNGDDLQLPTKRYPPNRPRGWASLPKSEKTWEASAIDSIKFDGLDKVKKWDIVNTLETLERYNGLGYRKYHPEINTPYLWSGTQFYDKGKYTEVKVGGKWKSKFDPALKSKQVGAVLLLKELGY